MSETFKQHVMNQWTLDCSGGIRNCAELLESAIDDYCKDSREKALAKTNLEQAVMWANKALALHGAVDDVTAVQ